MLREAAAILAGKRLEGEDELLRRQTFDCDPGIWAALHGIAASGGGFHPPATIAVE